jgi:hypothetical protein
MMRVSLIVASGGMSLFLPILGQGFEVRGPGGSSVEAFLRRELGISADYLKERVQTVFLNGRALDDFSAAVVTDGSVLALSAAMPGLAGAVLRRAGFYAAMRRSITHETRPAAAGDRAVRVTVKLFNLVAREIGPRLLRQGIRVEGSALGDLLSRLGRIGWGKILEAGIEGRPVEPEEMTQMLTRPGLVEFSVLAAAPAAG